MKRRAASRGWRCYENPVVREDMRPNARLAVERLMLKYLMPGMDADELKREICMGKYRPEAEELLAALDDGREEVAQVFVELPEVGDAYPDEVRAETQRLQMLAMRHGVLGKSIREWPHGLRMRAVDLIDPVLAFEAHMVGQASAYDALVPRV